MKKIAMSIAMFVSSFSFAFAENCMHIEEFAYSVVEKQHLEIVSPMKEVIELEDDSDMTPVHVTYADKNDELVEAIFTGEEVCYEALGLKLMRSPKS